LSISEIKTYRYACVEISFEERKNMATVIDLTAGLSKLTMLRGRTPTMTRAKREGSSARLASYRDGAIFASKSAGKGAWERHPDGDELEQVIEGSETLDIVTHDDPVQSIPVRAGMIAIVPRGAWHRSQYPDGITLLTVMPGKSEYVRFDIDAPRTAEPQRD
jgi:mannose-6-phosphate isomerase-like protein (cupin superfamily)